MRTTRGVEERLGMTVAGGILVLAMGLAGWATLLLVTLVFAGIAVGGARSGADSREGMDPGRDHPGASYDGTSRGPWSDAA